mmetsp:Transcript_24688/g.55602  ORF Transcript_24688/g.55602 Transcript_24688/m.55602 type:complete len:88 (-) Transcript_24688:144-407(-)
MPLLWTIRNLLRRGDGRREEGEPGDGAPKESKSTAPKAKALLCASFRLEDGTDAQVAEACDELGMDCRLLYDHLDQGRCRLQVITLR